MPITLRAGDVFKQFFFFFLGTKRELVTITHRYGSLSQPFTRNFFGRGFLTFSNITDITDNSQF